MLPCNMAGSTEDALTAALGGKSLAVSFDMFEDMSVASNLLEFPVSMTFLKTCLLNLNCQGLLSLQSLKMCLLCLTCLLLMCM